MSSKFIRTMAPALSCVVLIGLVAGCSKKEDDAASATPASSAKVTVEKTPTPTPTATASQNPPNGTATQQGPTKPDLARTKQASDDAKATKVAQKNAVANSEDWVVTVDPMEVEFGRIAVNTTAKASIILTNNGSEAMKLLQCKPTCGCTTTNCPTGRELQPGETTEVEVNLKGGARPGTKLNKMLTIIVEGQPPVPVKLIGETFTYVEFEPETIDPDTAPKGEVIVRAADDQPFRILSMSPPYIEEFGDEAKVEHVITFDWDKWEELGMPVKFNFRMDHPDCSTMTVTMGPKWRRKSFTQWREDPDAQDKATNKGDVLRAVRAGDLQSVQDAIAAGGNLRQTDPKTGASALILAAQNGHHELVNYFIGQKLSHNAVDFEGRSALSYASQKGHAKVVQVLLDAGCDPNRADGKKAAVSALSWASGFGNADTVDALINAGAEVETKNVAGMTPLMWAAGFGDAKRVNLLLKAGADVKARDLISQTTPLIYAARNGKAESVAALLQAEGINVNDADSKQRTALSWAVAALEQPVEKIQHLLAAGADPKLADAKEMTPLNWAATRLDDKVSKVQAVLQAAIAEEE